MAERLDKKIIELFEAIRNVYPEVGHNDHAPYSEYSAKGYNDMFHNTYSDYYVDYAERLLGKSNRQYVRVPNIELVIQQTLIKRYIGTSKVGRRGIYIDSLSYAESCYTNIYHDTG